MKEKIKFFIFILLFGFLLTALITSPYFLNLKNYYPLGQDNLFFSWFFQYIQKFSLSDVLFNQIELYKGNQFYPFPSTLAFNDTIIFPAFFIYKPIFFILNDHVLSLNSFIFISFVLTFISSFYSSYYFIKDRIGSIFTALIYTFAPMFLARFEIGHYEYLQRYFIPPLFVSFFIFLNNPRIKTGFLFYVFLTLSFLTNLQLSIFSIINLLFIFLLYILSKLKKKELFIWIKNVIKYSFLYSILFFPILFFIYRPYLNMSNKEKIIRPLNDVYNYGVELKDFISTSNHGLFLKLYRILPIKIITSQSADSVLFPGVIALSLFLYSVINKNKKTKFFKIIFLIIIFIDIILALGPYIIFNDKVIKFPYFYLYKYYFLLKASRTPGRIIITTMFFFSIFIGWIIKDIQKIRNRYKYIIILILFFLMVIEYKEPILLNKNTLDFPKINISDKKILFFPLNKDDGRNAVYSIYAIKSKSTIVNGYIGSHFDDYYFLEKELSRGVLSDRWFRILKTLNLDIIIFNNNYINNSYINIINSNHKEKIIYRDKDWLFLDLHKFKNEDCFDNLKENLIFEPKIIRPTNDKYIFDISVINASECNKKFFFEDRYLPIDFEIINKSRVIKGVTYLTLFPYLLKNESIIRELKIDSIFIGSRSEIKLNILNHIYSFSQ